VPPRPWHLPLATPNGLPEPPLPPTHPLCRRSAFPKLTAARLAAIDSVLREDVPGLVRAFTNPVA
jgi:hypothetical protein